MQYKYCEYCGRKIKINSNFCPFCGRKQIYHVTPQRDAPQSSDSLNDTQQKSKLQSSHFSSSSINSIKMSSSQPNNTSINPDTTNKSSNVAQSNATGNTPNMSRVEMHEKQNQDNQNFNINKYKDKAKDYQKHLKSGFNSYLSKRGYNGNNMDDVVKNLWKPFGQHNIFLIYPAVIASFYLIEFMLAIDTATGGNVQMDLSNSVMSNFPFTARFGVIMMGSVPVIISIVLGCLPWFWTQVVALLPMIFGTSSMMSEAENYGSVGLFKFILILLIALLIYSRLDPRFLYGNAYPMYKSVKKGLTIGLIALTGVLFIMSLKAFYLLIKPELFGTLAIILICLACGAFPSIKFGWVDALGGFHKYF